MSVAPRSLRFCAVVKYRVRLYFPAMALMAAIFSGATNPPERRMVTCLEYSVVCFIKMPVINNCFFEVLR